MNKHFREPSFDLRHKTSENTVLSNGMSEKVQILANNIYKEFERLISFYGSDVVEFLMPLTVNILENLEELYQDKETYEMEIELLKEDNIALNKQYEKDKISKKQAEERVLLIEYAYEEEKKLWQEKLLTSESVNRMLEMKNRNLSDSVVRLEEKVHSLKSENQKLYDRYTEVLKSHAEQLNKIKAETFRDSSPIYMASHSRSNRMSSKNSHREAKSKSKSMVNTDNILANQLETDQVKLDSNLSDGLDISLDHADKLFTSGYISHEEETVADIIANDQWITDFSDCGNYSDPMMSNRDQSNFDNNTGFYVNSSEIIDKSNANHSLESNSDTDVTDDEYGIGREIESLIRENQELVDTKNALNVVKDDLISRLDQMTSENDVLKEDLGRFSNREADLKGKLTHLEYELKMCKEEILKKESEFQEVQRTETEKTQEKPFSRADVAVLLEERNYYKEKLMELQDAIVYKEMCRVKKQFPEYKQPVKPVKQNNSTIWNFFSKLTRPSKSQNIRPEYIMKIRSESIALDMLNPDVMDNIDSLK